MQKNRRDWTPEAKKRVLKDWLASGLSAHRYAKTHDVGESSLLRWQAQLQGKDEVKPAVFVPLEIQQTQPSNTQMSPTIEIHVGETMIRVRPGFDVETLTRVLRAVGDRHV